MSFLFVLIFIAIVAGIALVATGRLGELPPAEPDLRPDYLGDAPAFDVVVRGYRMDEVDATIELLNAQISELKAARD